MVLPCRVLDAAFCVMDQQVGSGWSMPVVDALVGGACIVAALVTLRSCYETGVRGAEARPGSPRRCLALLLGLLGLVLLLDALPAEVSPGWLAAALKVAVEVGALLVCLQAWRPVATTTCSSPAPTDDRLLQSAIESLGAGVWEWFADGNGTADPRACGVLGVEWMATARPLAVLLANLAPEDRERTRQQVVGAIAAGVDVRLQFRVQRPGRDVRHAASACMIVNAGGGGSRLVGVLFDVTDRIRGDNLFRIVFESAPCGMLLVAADGSVRMANDNACRLFGYSRDELVGSSVEALVPAAKRDGHVALRERFFATAEAREMAAGRDLVALRRDGSEVPVEIMLSPVVFGDEPAVISTITDITPRRSAEAEREQYAVELERRNRALDEFAYLVSHDLKAPLRAVSMISEWLEEDLGPRLDESAREQLGRLRERARQMHVLIEGSLSYARANIEEGVAEPLAVAEVLHDVLRLIDAPAGAVVTVGELPVLNYDRDQLLKVLMNLVSNALTYGAGAPVRISASTDGAEVAIHVADDGPGIDPRYHEHVFRMFKRIPGSAGQSSGVGLAIVRMLVERNGGRVSLVSQPGEGATFSFTVPHGRVLQGSGEGSQS